MSNKGAIKKSDTKSLTNSQTHSKSKISSKNNVITEKNEKLETENPKTSQLADSKNERSKRSKPLQNFMPNKTQSSRNAAKQNVERKVVTKASSSSTMNSTTVSSTSRNSTKSLSSRNKIEGTKRDNINVKDKSKSTEKIQKGYSEKRGQSTIYMPKSTASKLNSISNEKTIYSTHERKKLSNSKPLQKDKSRADSKERRRSRTLSPSEVKVLHLNKNKASSLGKVAGTSKLNKSMKADAEASTEEEYSYEDDFEDYESDFQECTDTELSQVSEESNDNKGEMLDAIELCAQEQRKLVHSTETYKTEEEQMHDSGHYELAEARKRAAKMETMLLNQSKTPTVVELREPVIKAYSDDRPLENKSLPSSTDEGFEDSRSGDFAKSPPLSQMSFIDFRKTKEEAATKPQKPQKPVHRGQQLLEMIKLDKIGCTLLECMPIPYEEFIRNYGKLNTQQTSTQTGDDNLDVETQTVEILRRNTWTQFPVTCRNELRTNEDVQLFRLEHVGVGSDDSIDSNIIPQPSYDILKLNEFLERAGRVMLSLLEERKLGGNVFSNNTDDLPFSESSVKLSVESVTFLSGRAVTLIHYSESLTKVLLTVHAPAEEEIETSNKQDYITDCCVGCVWNITEPSMPVKLFYSVHSMTACCFHLTNHNIVLAGLEDGSISLWDLREDEMWHQKVTDKANERDYTIRSNTYTTAGSIESSGHGSRIIAIRVLSKLESRLLERNKNKFVSIQICSLDEEGCLIIWSILPNMGKNVDDLGLSQWGDIRLVMSQVIPVNLRTDVSKNNIDMFVDMHVDSIDNNSLYIATNTSNILHASCIGDKANPLMYRRSEMDPSGATTCLERCPFKQSYFLVGCDDGTVRLHTVSTGRPILQLKHGTSKIRAIQWSKSKPFTIFVLDSDSRLYIWDLNESDMCPIHTTQLKDCGEISAMQLSPCKNEQDMINQYLAVGTQSGSVKIYKINNKFHYSKKDDFIQEMNIFMRYVAIL